MDMIKTIINICSAESDSPYIHRTKPNYSISNKKNVLYTSNGRHKIFLNGSNVRLHTVRVGVGQPAQRSAWTDNLVYDSAAASPGRDAHLKGAPGIMEAALGE